MNIIILLIIILIIIYNLSEIDYILPFILALLNIINKIARWISISYIILIILINIKLLIFLIIKWV